MGQTAFAKIAPAHAPAAAAAGKGEGERCVFIGIETGREAQIGRPAAKQFVDRLAEQIFAGAIDETKPAVRIEGEDRDIDFGHDGAKERGRFEGAEALDAQGFAQLIDFKQNLAERVIGLGAAGPNRVIAFPQGGEKIAHRLKRPNDVLARTGEIP